MSKRLRRLIESQPKVKVAQHAHDAGSDARWFVVLAAIAGAFYFGVYYWWGVWRALAGG
jgi:hypothetical protein